MINIAPLWTKNQAQLIPYPICPNPSLQSPINLLPQGFTPKISSEIWANVLLSPTRLINGEILLAGKGAETPLHPHLQVLDSAVTSLQENPQANNRNSKLTHHHQITQLILRHSGNFLTTSEQHLLAYLSTYAKIDGSNIKVSHSTIAENLGCSEKHVQRNMKTLKVKTAIIETEPSCAYPQKPATHKINIPLLQEWKKQSFMTARKEKNKNSGWTNRPLGTISPKRVDSQSSNHKDNNIRYLLGDESPQKKSTEALNLKHPLENPKPEQEAARRQSLRSDLTAKQPSAKEKRFQDQFSLSENRFGLKDWIPIAKGNGLEFHRWEAEYERFVEYYASLEIKKTLREWQKPAKKWNPNPKTKEPNETYVEALNETNLLDFRDFVKKLPPDDPYHDFIKLFGGLEACEKARFYPQYEFPSDNPRYRKDLL